MKDVEFRKGDIWMDRDGSPSHIIKVTKNRVSYWWDDDDDEEDPDMATEHKNVFLLRHTLIERDGEPYLKPREFTWGSFYPVIDENGANNIAYYNTQGKFKMIGSPESFEVSDVSWIGKELKVEHLNETSI